MQIFYIKFIKSSLPWKHISSKIRNGKIISNEQIFGVISPFSSSYCVGRTEEEIKYFVAREMICCFWGAFAQLWVEDTDYFVAFRLLKPFFLGVLIKLFLKFHRALERTKTFLFLRNILRCYQENLFPQI